MLSKNYYDPEAQFQPSFEEISIRRAFIRKVYFILMIQLLVSFGFVCVFTYSEPAKEMVYRNPYLMWVAMGVLLVFMLALACCESLRRQVPVNFVCLAILTLAQSFLLGVVSVVHSPETVMMAVGLTAGICLALTLFAFQTRFDFTVCGTGLMIMMLLLMVLGLVAIFVPNRTLHMVYCCLGALLISLYLVYDTQLMMGGSRAYSLSPEEYIFAALNLYVDIVTLFMYILGILGGADD